MVLGKLYNQLLVVQKCKRIGRGQGSGTGKNCWKSKQKVKKLDLVTNEKEDLKVVNNHFIKRLSKVGFFEQNS